MQNEYRLIWEEIGVKAPRVVESDDLDSLQTVARLLANHCLVRLSSILLQKWNREYSQYRDWSEVETRKFPKGWTFVS